LPKASFWKQYGTRVLVLLATLSLVGAAIFGSLNVKTNVQPYLTQVMPQATNFVLLKSQPAVNQYLYAASDAAGQIGYVSFGQGQGYGGPDLVAVAWSNTGTILNVQMVATKDTPAYYNKLYSNNSAYFAQYIGRSYADAFQVSGGDIDAASGATRSSNGVAQGVRDARTLLSQQLGHPIAQASPQIQFGFAEIMALTGIALVFIFRMVPPLRRLSWPRPVMLFFGLVVFGLILDIPLSLANFTVFLIGFQPAWQTDLALYTLVFGLIALALVFAKNFWCFWICPFVALQEGMHFVGSPKPRPITQHQLFLRNTRFVILWGALMLVFLLRQPALASYEPWDGLFNLSGNLPQWLLVAGTLGTAVFIYNFWCHYLCPVGAVMDIVIKVRMLAVNGAKRLFGK